MSCPRCGHEHPTRADVEACEAMAGHVRPYNDDGPEVMCTLCRYIAPHGPLLMHFAAHHAGEQAAARLVRPVRIVGHP